jgi:acetyl-CoA carboxylase biotin carboxyl carrier protein
MNLKEIKELVDLITEKAITEFELERGGVRLRIKRELPGAPAAVQTSIQGAGPLLVPDTAAPAVAAAPAAPAAASAPPAPAPEAEELHLVKSPIVGTFYEAPTPGAPPFVKIGDHVQPGKVLCIIEAMKLMNEIESDAAGEIVQCFVENAQPVEYGESLFAIRPGK